MAARSEDEDEFTEKIRQLEKEKKRLERLNSERKYKELCKSVTALRESSSSLYSTEPAQYESSAGSSSSPGRDRSRASARFDDMSSDSGISGILNEQRNLLKSLQRRSGESSRDILGGRGQQRESGSDSEEDCAKDTRNLDKVMSKEHKQKLQQNRDTLVENLIPEDIFNDLIANKVLTTPEVGRIKEKNTRESINEELLDNLIRKSDRAFYEFVKSLRKTLQDHLADLIDDMIRDDRTRDDRNRSKRKRKTGELNISLDCEDISPVGRKKRVCTCAEVEEQILVMAKTAYQAIRRRDGTPASFEQFKKELRQTNEVIKESMEIMHTLKILCKHGELDISYGSVRFTLNCSSMRCVQNVWEMYQSGKLLALFQEKFVSRQLLKMCGARTIKLGVRIAEHEYWKCIKELGKLKF
ncbi:hypothetical protein FSP39_010920 [Pinctada imbricata]|uniref:CARD domain-containing protein n=1 Tax=Pinctada imbricata TaxID=66713 RepID=A0AA89C168_PINIB|nr:hypothetical protein FSP39_010920 [Pinctada imbricata]